MTFWKILSTQCSNFFLIFPQTKCLQKKKEPSRSTMKKKDLNDFQKKLLTVKKVFENFSKHWQSGKKNESNDFNSNFYIFSWFTGLLDTHRNYFCMKNLKFLKKISIEFVYQQSYDCVNHGSTNDNDNTILTQT